MVIFALHNPIQRAILDFGLFFEVVTKQMINGFEYFPRCRKLKPKGLSLAGPPFLLLKDKLFSFFPSALRKLRANWVCSDSRQSD